MKGSIWRDEISIAILRLQESGYIQELYRKWWQIQDKPEGLDCSLSDDKADSVQLHFESVIGVFIVVGFGILTAIVVAFVEFTWKSQKGQLSASFFRQGFQQDLKHTCDNFFENEFQNIFHKK